MCLGKMFHNQLSYLFVLLRCHSSVPVLGNLLVLLFSIPWDLIPQPVCCLEEVTDCSILKPHLDISINHSPVLSLPNIYYRSPSALEILKTGTCKL